MSQCQMCGREIPDGQQLCPTCRNAWEWRQRQQAQAAGAAETGAKGPESSGAGKASKPEQPAKSPKGAKDPKPAKPPKAPKAAAKAPQPGRMAAVILGAALVVFLLFFGAALIFGSRSGGQQGAPVTLDTWQGDSADTQTVDPGPEQIVAEAPEQMLPQQQPTDPQQTTDTGEYIFPNSNSAYLTREQVAALTLDQLRLARNEIYARHGRIFQGPALTPWEIPF